jgi:pimeloyl-ACP methyl ester carboxylesterase
MPTHAHGTARWLRYLLLLALAVPVTATAQGRVATINGERLYYEVAGEGTPLVLIHGWSLNLRMWDQQVSALSRRFRVIRYDRRGFGKSSGSEDVSWDAADLDALLDHLGITKTHILGMSQGARAALRFTLSHPDRVSAHPARSPGPGRVRAAVDR